MVAAGVERVSRHIAQGCKAFSAVSSEGRGAILFHPIAGNRSARFAVYASW